MSTPARIQLPGAPKRRWSRGRSIWLAVSAAGAIGLGAWGSAAQLPGPLAAAGLYLVVALMMLMNLTVTAGRAAWVLVGRAGASSLAARISNARLWMIGVSAMATTIGFTLTDAEPRVQALGPALAAGGVAFATAGIAGRIAITRAAHRLVVRLSTSMLAQLDRARGDLELVVTVPADAPTIEVPFLHGKWAAVELLLEGEAHRWPDRLPVRDASDTGELALGACDLAGWRWAMDTVSWSSSRVPPLVESLRAAVGTRGPLAADSGSRLWCVRAIAPGDTLYIIGDAEEVRRGFGFRAEGQNKVGATGGRPAFAYIGDETRLRAMLVHELRYLPLVGLLGVAGVAALVWAAVRLAT